MVVWQQLVLEGREGARRDLLESRGEAVAQKRGTATSARQLMTEKHQVGTQLQGQVKQYQHHLQGLAADLGIYKDSGSWSHLEYFLQVSQCHYTH